MYTKTKENIEVTESLPIGRIIFIEQTIDQVGNYMYLTKYHNMLPCILLQSIPNKGYLPNQTRIQHAKIKTQPR